MKVDPKAVKMDAKQVGPSAGCSVAYSVERWVDG